ncbi:MAG: redoxin domain-containing protein [Gammaproteobacteria bacterium]|nr:redoxin domain-containing protein [Gammaproteobacteria bacterium]
MNRGLLAVIAVVAAAGWYGAHQLVSQGNPRGASGIRVAVGETSPPSAADAIPTPVPGALPAPRIPERIPPFTLPDLSGRPTAISAYDGRSLIINFWATWCAPCRREIPLLKTVDAAWKDRRFQVLGIAVDRRAQVASFAQKLQISYPLLAGQQDALDVAAAFGVATPAFPFTVFTDAHRRIVALYLGELHRPQINLILGVVQRVNDGHLGLPQARHAIDAGLAQLQAESAAG